MAELHRPTHMGTFATDAEVLTFIQGNHWDTDGDGTGDPPKGFSYTNDTNGVTYTWNGSAWSVGGGSTLKRIWNPTKLREEVWHKSGSNWTLWEASPGRVWHERYVGAPAFAATVLGLNMELSWAVNGRLGGAVAPNDACFVAANEIGGGLSLNAIAGGSDDDYTAIHLGDNYPTTIAKSPHLKIHFSPEQIGGMAYIVGLVDDTRSAGTAAFALPDNGLFVYYDTDVDAFPHYVIRSGGVNFLSTAGTTPVAGDHKALYIQSDGTPNTIRFLYQHEVVVPWTSLTTCTDLLAAQLQPYVAVVNRAAGQLRQFHLHDFRMIIDAGF